MKYLPIFLFALSLFATVNEPLRCEVFSGYRNNRIHWHLVNDGKISYSKLYRDIEYWETGLVLKVIHRDLTFFLRGAYGTLGKHWTADATGYAGYAVNLTADRTYKVILTPLIGYSGHFETLHPEDFRLVWNGFLFGAGLTVEPGGRLVFNLGYAYNILSNKVHTKLDSDLFSSMKTSSPGNMGQSGWAQMDYILTRFWRMGIGAQINYFSSRVVDAHVQQIEGANIKQMFKMRWTAVSGWLQISREF